LGPVWSDAPGCPDRFVGKRQALASRVRGNASCNKDSSVR
jgi:hypothetical protein